MSRTFAILLALLIIGLTSLAFGQETAAGQPVLLRYKLAPGDAQVYDCEAKLTMQIKAGNGTPAQDSSIDMALDTPFSIKGTARNDDGTMDAEVRFHGLDVGLTMTADGQTVRMTADTDGLEMTRNGSTMISAPWGSSELSGFPDMGQLLNAPIQVRFNDRGELVEVLNGGQLGAAFQGFDLNQTVDNQIVYPEKPVGPGDRWQHELTQKVANAALPGGTMALHGTATYTVLERGTYRNRDCLKLGLNATFDMPEAGQAMDFDQTVKGIAYIDIATGVPLDCRLQISQHLSGSAQGVEFNMSSSGTVTVSYTGGKRKLAELLRTSAGAVQALNDLRVPIVTEQKIKINDAFYEKGQTVTIDGKDYTVVAFKSTALKLHRLSDSAVYQLGFGSAGTVTYVKLLGYAD